MCEDVCRTLLRATYFFVKKIAFRSLLDFVVVEPYFTHWLGLLRLTLHFG